MKSYYIDLRMKLEKVGQTMGVGVVTPSYIYVYQTPLQEENDWEWVKSLPLSVF